MSRQVAGANFTIHAGMRIQAVKAIQAALPSQICTWHQNPADWSKQGLYAIRAAIGAYRRALVECRHHQQPPQMSQTTDLESGLLGDFAILQTIHMEGTRK